MLEKEQRERQEKEEDESEPEDDEEPKKEESEGDEFDSSQEYDVFYKQPEIQETKDLQKNNLFEDIESRRQELYEEALGSENLQFLNKFYIDYKELESEHGKYDQLRVNEKRTYAMQ